MTRKMLTTTNTNGEDILSFFNILVGIKYKIHSKYDTVNFYFHPSSIFKFYIDTIHSLGFSYVKRYSCQ